MNKELLLYLLENHYVEVIFTKKDNSIRKMLCTLQKGIIPDITSSKKRLEGLVTVWDVENEGWRSFYVNSILSVRVLAWVDFYSKEV